MVMRGLQNTALVKTVEVMEKTLDRYNVVLNVRVGLLKAKLAEENPEHEAKLTEGKRKSDSSSVDSSSSDAEYKRADYEARYVGFRLRSCNLQGVQPTDPGLLSLFQL